VGGSAYRPGHTLPQPELPESPSVSSRPQAGKVQETREAAAAKLGRHRGFSSKLQKERLRIAHGLENPEV